ncbi:MAG: hypothetical protein ABI772_11220 [Bacteroidota bacterium]
MTIGIICSGNHLDSWQVQWLMKFRETNGVQMAMVSVDAGHPVSPLAESFSENIPTEKLREFVPPLAPGINPEFYINFTTSSIKKSGIDTGKILHFDFLLNSYSTLLYPLQTGSSVTEINLLRISKDGSITICETGVYRTVLHSIEKQVRSITEQAGFMLTEYILRTSPLPTKFVSVLANPEINGAVLNKKVFSAFTKHIFNLMFTSFRWNIGITTLTPEQLLKQPSSIAVNWMKEEKGRSFNADPFIISDGDALRIFFEHFPVKSGKGILCNSSYNKNQFSAYTKTLEKESHLSYPFIIEHEQKKYILPENADSGKVTLYEVDDAFRISDSKVLIDNMDAVDPTIVKWNNKWWMFCTRKQHKSSDLRLYIYHADELNGTWNAHQQNPVKCDVRNARPAGTFFIIDNKLYRPSQDSSKTYGGRIVINHVIELTTESFTEKYAAAVEPKQLTGNYKYGVHTISFINGYMAVDGKKKIAALRRFA